MRACRELRRFVAIQRHFRAGRNGVVAWLWDAPRMEIKASKNAKRLQRHKRINLDILNKERSR